MLGAPPSFDLRRDKTAIGAPPAFDPRPDETAVGAPPSFDERQESTAVGSPPDADTGPDKTAINDIGPEVGSLEGSRPPASSEPSVIVRGRAVRDEEDASSRRSATVAEVPAWETNPGVQSEDEVPGERDTAPMSSREFQARLKAKDASSEAKPSPPADEPAPAERPARTDDVGGRFASRSEKSGASEEADPAGRASKARSWRSQSGRPIPRSSERTESDEKPHEPQEVLSWRRRGDEPADERPKAPAPGPEARSWRHRDQASGDPVASDETASAPGEPRARRRGTGNDPENPGEAKPDEPSRPRRDRSDPRPDRLDKRDGGSRGQELDEKPGNPGRRKRQGSEVSRSPEDGPGGGHRKRPEPERPARDEAPPPRPTRDAIPQVAPKPTRDAIPAVRPPSETRDAIPAVRSAASTKPLPYQSSEDAPEDPAPSDEPGDEPGDEEAGAAGVEIAPSFSREEERDDRSEGDNGSRKEDEPASARPAAGAWSRREAEPEPEPVPDKKPGRMTLRHLTISGMARAADPALRQRLTVVGLVAGILLLGAILYSIFSSIGDRPTDAELRIIYPYGFTGAHGPRGEYAPGAAEIDFELLGEEPCRKGSADVCLRYEFSSGFFSGTMLVKNTSMGWQRFSDEGLPFRPGAQPGQR